MISDDESSVYTGGESSSAYSYKDFVAYQYSHFEDDGNDNEEAEHNTPQKKAATAVDAWEKELEEYENKIDWEDSDNESLVMHSQCDDDEFELYQFSDEDLIPEEPDFDWIIAALIGNRRDYVHLELLLEEVEDLPRLVEAILMNRVVKNVTIYEAFLEALPTDEQKKMLAEAVCNMPNLEQLQVYYHSSFFVEPLQRIHPTHLKRLCLMFFPNKVEKDTLSLLTKIVQNGEEDENQHANEGGDRQLASLEQLSLRCHLMDDDFLLAIAKGMEQNCTLTTLSFWGKNVDVSDEGSRASAKIDFYLKLNQAKIRNLHLLANASPSEFLDKIVEEQDSIDHIFYLLVTNPSFVSYCIYCSND